MSLMDIFEPDQIIGSTINGWISFPTPFLCLIYLVMGVMLIRAFVAHRAGQKQAVAKSVVVMLLSAGMLHAVVSDITWTRWVFADVRLFGGRSSEQKLAAMDGEIYQFIRKCRSVVGDNDYVLYPYSGDGDDDALRSYFCRKLEYYLLPARKKPDAKYIVVMADKTVFYDEKAHVFHEHNGKEMGATMLINDNDSYVLRKK